MQQWKDRECEVMSRAEHLNRALYAVYSAQVRNRLARVNPLPQVMFKEEDVFSKMYYGLSDNSSFEFFEYIEPLVGILRDPLTMCEHFSNILTKEVSCGSFAQKSN